MFNEKEQINQELNIRLNNQMKAFYVIVHNIMELANSLDDIDEDNEHLIKHILNVIGCVIHNDDIEGIVNIDEIIDGYTTSKDLFVSQNEPEMVNYHNLPDDVKEMLDTMFNNINKWQDED